MSTRAAVEVQARREEVPKGLYRPQSGHMITDAYVYLV